MCVEELPPPPSTPRYQSKLWPWGSLASQAPFSTRETKRGAASLHRIKQSLNASSCYTLPNETFMKGPLMWFQKHLVIIPGAAHLRSVDVWMNASEPLQRAAVPTVLLAGEHLANIACGFVALPCLRMTAWASLGSEERTQGTQTKAYLCSLLICLLEVSEAVGFLTERLSFLFSWQITRVYARVESQFLRTYRKKKLENTHDFWVSHSAGDNGFLRKTPDLLRTIEN